METCHDTVDRTVPGQPHLVVSSKPYAEGAYRYVGRIIAKIPIKTAAAVFKVAWENM